MNIKYIAKSNIGPRPSQEDTVHIAGMSIQAEAASLSGTVDGGLFAVFDGAGGELHGAAASKAAAGASGKCLPPPTLDDINITVKKTGGFTTMAGAFFGDDGETFLYCIGDSRVYFAGQEHFQCLTIDQTTCMSAVKAGLISNDEARELHPPLLYALGGTIDAEESVFPFSVEPGDKFLLCTDGVWECMDSSLTWSGTPSLEEMDKLLTMCISKAEDDNHSYILLEVV